MTSLPPKVTAPALGLTSPLMHLSTVDFPAPLGPIRYVPWPSQTFSETPFRYLRHHIQRRRCRGKVAAAYASAKRVF